MQMRHFLAVTGLALAGAIPAVHAAGSDTGLNLAALSGQAGVDYLSGKYGAQKSTDITTAYGELFWDATSTTTLSLELPYVFQTAPAGTIGGSGRGHQVHSNKGANLPQVSSNGIGDVTLGIDQYLLTQERSQVLDWGLRGSVKFGTADVAKGLGSGQTDYTGSTYVGHQWGRLYGEAEIGYAILGSPNSVTVNNVAENVQFRNYVFEAAKVDYYLTDRLMLGARFDRLESREHGLPAEQTVELDSALKLGRDTKLRADVLFGLNNNSPDFGAGASIETRF